MRLTLRDKDYNLGLWAFANEGSHANGNQTSKISGTAEKRPSAAAFFARRIRFQLLLLSFCRHARVVCPVFFRRAVSDDRRFCPHPQSVGCAGSDGGVKNRRRPDRRLYYRHMRAFIERNQDVNYSKPVIFYLLPVRRLVAASVLSGGLFELYWLYKNWKAVREDAKDNEIRPAVYGWLLGPFFVWPLFKIIRINLKRSKTEGKRFVPPAVGYTACFWLQIACAAAASVFVLPAAGTFAVWGIYLGAWAAGLTFLSSIQKRINFHDRKSNHKLELPARWQKTEIAVVIVGLLLNCCLFFIRLPAEQNDENLGLALGSTYRMMEGYAGFCRKQGYEMTRFPQVYAEYFRPELETINAKLKPYGLTMEQAWEFFRVRLNNVMDDSIMSEFMTLKPAIIELIVKQYKAEKIDNFDENVAREYLEKEITLPVLCSETDNNARVIIDNNETYKKFFRETVQKIK